MLTETARPIAVIGMACRYPGASNLLELWENILARRQQFRVIPEGRLPQSDYHASDPAAPDKTYGLKAAVLDGFQFDPSAYRIPKSTFEGTDIVHWLALATALDALTHSGLALEALPSDTAGAIIGNTLTGEQTRAGSLRVRWPFIRKVLRGAAEARGLPEQEVRDLEAVMEQMYKSVFPPVTEDTLAGGLANTIAGRICNYLDWHGGGYVVDGACSSSLLAIATAADYLQQGKLDLAIAGGVDVSLDAFELIGFSKAKALTRDEMRVYDRRGSGFTPGEGCGMVVLKRLDDARRDCDVVYAVLRGWGVSSDGRGGITAPNAKGQSRALIRAYQHAGYAPQALAFIEGHGTGTAVGDRTELEGIASALAAFGPTQDHGIGVTSFKSIVGHTKAAAGVGGFIKAVIAVNRRIVPPTAGCSEPHASFGDAARGLYPVLDGEIRAADEQLRAGISAMGFGGINCHLTIESGDPPASVLTPSLPEGLLMASSQQTEVIALSASALPELIDAVQALRQAVTGLASGELVDVAARCASDLRSLPWRAALVAGTVDELHARLESLGRRLLEDPPGPGILWRGDHVWIGHAVDTGRVGFLFPGQGSQQVGMARTLVERFDWARDFVARSDAEVAAVRAAVGGREEGEMLSKLYLRGRQRDPAKELESRWKEALTRTENAQPAICIASWLWVKRLEEVGIVPQLVGGHSLGELTALAAAGAYDPDGLVRLAALRGAVMASSDGSDAGIMGVLHCDAESAKKIIDRAGGGYCAIANLNAPNQTVISGETQAVRRAVDLAVTEGLRAGVLPVANAFHSRLVESAADTFRHRDDIPAVADKLVCRVFSSIDGREIEAGLRLRSHLANQIVSPVDFTRMVEAMSEQCDWFVEVGPGRVLSGLVQSHDTARVRPCFPVEGRAGRDADFNAVVAEAFTRGLDLKWQQLYANRLVRPFMPAAKRKFYVNPCEREMPVIPASVHPSVFRPDQWPSKPAGMAGQTDLPSFAARLTATLCNAARAEHAMLVLHDEADKAQHVILPAHLAGHRIPAEQGIFSAVFHSGAAEAIEVLIDDPRFDLELDGLGIAPSWTALYVPIAVAAGTIGVVRLARSSGVPFIPLDADIVTEVANSAAPALLQAYLNERWCEASRIERRLRDVVSSSVGNQLPAAALMTVAESARMSLGAECAFLLRYDREANAFWSLLAAGGSHCGGGQPTGSIQLGADSGIVGQVFRTLEPLHLANACADPRFDPDIERLTHCLTRSIDCVPLLTMTGEPLGVLLLVNRRFPADRGYLAEMGRRAGELLSHQPLFDQLSETKQVLKAAICDRHPPSPRPEEPALDEPASAEAVPANSVRTVLLGLISGQTGFAADTLHDEARLIDDLNLDSIKTGALLADAALKLGLQGQIDPLQLTGATIGTVIAAFEDAQGSNGGGISAMDELLDLVVERTGFDRRCLSADQRLLDDLNIDSIKAGSLLGDLLLRTRTAGRLEAGVLAGGTLGEIAKRVQDAMEGLAAKQPEGAVDAEPPLEARWVRSFSASRVRAPRSPSRIHPLQSDDLFLWALGEEPCRQWNGLAQRLGTRLFVGRELALDTLPEQPLVLVLVLSGGEHACSEAPSLAAVDELSALHDLARLAPSLWQGLRAIVFIQHTGGRSLSAAPGPSARSFAASLNLERPELEVLVLDFDPVLQAGFIAERLTEELTGQARYEAVEYDAEEARWTRCIRPVEPENCVPRSVQWSLRDVFLVTGGGKGITAECALAWARETGVKLALLGRSPAPSSGEDSELAATLQRFAAAGIDYRYYRADVADRSALERAVVAIRRDLGPITGVLHGAGTNVPRPLIEVSAEAARLEIRSKLQGAENLVALFEAAPPKLFAAFTSIIGVTGMRNNAWYAYSNEATARLLDAFADSHPETEVVSYAYSIWDEVGMGVKLGSVRHLGQLGIDAVPVAEGVRQFLRWMRTAPPLREVIVAASAAGLPTWVRPPAMGSTARARRFDGVPRRFEPGIELVTQLRLDAKHDLYLADHNYRGTLLFPTVMGLEAMAQACLRVSGTTELEVTRIEDIQLERPIVVHPDRGATIEIRALALERVSPADPLIVEAAIHAEHTHFEPIHFSARFVLGRRDDPACSVTAPPEAGLLGIVPSIDLYGSVLFQGPLFQRISGVEALDERHIIFRTEARAATSRGPEGFADEIRASLVLGDPYYRDSLLQAGQASLTPDVCLPIRIGRIDRYATKIAEGQYRAEAKVIERAGSLVTVDVTVFDEQGQLIERISGYQVKVLERRADLPTPASLVGCSDRSEHDTLQADLDQRAALFGLSAPAVVVRRIPGLHAKRREERRSITRPLFHAALCQAGQREAVNTGHFEVSWLDSGKPVLVPRGEQSGDLRQRLGDGFSADGLRASMQVSLSHENEMALCAAGSGPQGCDLVVPACRDRRQWRAMLSRPLFALVERLEADGESLDRAGARVWSALEAAMKALDTRDIALDTVARRSDAVLFHARNVETSLRVMTFPGRITGAEFMLAVVVSDAAPQVVTVPKEQTHLLDIRPAKTRRKRPLSTSVGTVATAGPGNQDCWTGWLAAGGEPSDFFGIDVDCGARVDEPRITFRFPLAFKDGANPDGTLYFVRYFEWMGRLREMALRPVLAQLTGEFTSGEWAWVTNRSWAQVERPVYAGDVVEVSGRFLSRSGPGNATVTLEFDWQRVTADASLERVATTQIQMTWARVIGHGVVTPEPYPPYLERFFREFPDQKGDLAQRDMVCYREALGRIGEGLWRAQPGPAAGVVIAEQSVSTSLNDANLVGNVYYAKCYELQGALRDSYFHGVIPEAYQRTRRGGGIRCIFTEVRHLRDAMPFETLNARMRVVAVHEAGIELGFDIFRISAEGEPEKLATGTQIAAWMETAGAGDTWEIMRLPSSIRDRLWECLRAELSIEVYQAAA